MTILILQEALQEQWAPPLMEHMDFVRGKDALSVPVRSVVLPDILMGKQLDIVIAKAVIATGCTAISLVKKAYEKYMPKVIIITVLFIVILVFLN